MQCLDKAVEWFEQQFPEHKFNWRQSGSRYMALCPFHEEKNPSFNIYTLDGETVFYKCFACGKSGVVGKAKKQAYFNLVNIINKANQFLLESREHLEALQSKTGADVRAVETYKIGLLTRDILQEKEIQILEKKHRLSEKEGFLIFPYFSTSGHLIGFKVRNIFESSKTSRYVKLYQKAKGYFGLPAFVKELKGILKPCFVVEGETDALAVYQKTGLPCVAVGGTSGYTALIDAPIHDLDLLPIILPDFDDMSFEDIGAGRKAVIKLQEHKASKHFDRKIYCLVDEIYKKDPCDGKDDLSTKLIFSSSVQPIELAATTFQEQWREWKLDKSRAIIENFKSKGLDGLAEIYADALNISDEFKKERYVSTLEKLEEEMHSKEPKKALLKRFPQFKISVMSAFGGAGKTTFALITSYRLVSQYFNPYGLRVLFWTTEHSRQQLYFLDQKVRNIFDETTINIAKKHISVSDEPPFYLIDPAIKRVNPEAVRLLRKRLEEFDVIFLDPLLSFLGVEENENAYIRSAFDAIHGILSEFEDKDRPKAIVFISHFSKQNLRELVLKEEDITNTEDGKGVKSDKVNLLLSSVRGASAIVDSARYVETIIKTQDGTRYCFTVKTNDITTRRAGEGETIPDIFSVKKEDKKEEPTRERFTEGYENDYEYLDF